MAPPAVGGYGWGGMPGFRAASGDSSSSLRVGRWELRWRVLPSTATSVGFSLSLSRVGTDAGADGCT